MTILHIHAQNMTILHIHAQRVRFAGDGDGDGAAVVEKDVVEFDGVKALVPIVYSCLHLLYDSDGVLNRCAFKALQSLIVTCIEQDAKARSASSNDNSWLRLTETTLVPALKTRIATRNVSVRRSFIRLLSEVSKGFASHPSPHLYGDLHALARTDDEELDFFLNITHVQIIVTIYIPIVIPIAITIATICMVRIHIGIIKRLPLTGTGTTHTSAPRPPVIHLI